RGALAHRDHEALGNEHRDLAEVNLLLLIEVARGSEHREQDLAVVISLDLWPQMQVLRVLDRELVQAEPLLYLAQLGLVGFEQPEPHEAVLLAHLRRLTELDRSIVLAPPIPVKSTVNDHRGLLVTRFAVARFGIVCANSFVQAMNQ